VHGIRSRLTSHTSDFGLLPVQQSAYCPFHSIETAVLCVHNLVRSVDDGQVCRLVLLDLSVAFDTVDHQILLSVLSSVASLSPFQYRTQLVPILPD